MRGKQFALPCAAGAILLLLLSCSADHATEMSTRKQPGATVSVQADAHGWVYLEKGQTLQIAGHRRFEVKWLFGIDPCNKPMEFKQQPKGVTVGQCTMAENSVGSYAFQVDAREDSPVFVRVGPCENCSEVPLDVVREHLRTKAPFRVATIAIGCQGGQTRAIPAEMKAERQELISWARSGTTPAWKLTFENASLCRGAQTLTNKQPVCVLADANTPGTTVAYRIALQGCENAGSGKLTIVK